MRVRQCARRQSLRFVFDAPWRPVWRFGIQIRTMEYAISERLSAFRMRYCILDTRSVRGKATNARGFRVTLMSNREPRTLTYSREKFSLRTDRFMTVFESKVAGEQNDKLNLCHLRRSIVRCLFFYEHLRNILSRQRFNCGFR